MAGQAENTEGKIMTEKIKGLLKQFVRFPLNELREGIEELSAEGLALTAEECEFCLSLLPEDKFPERRELFIQALEGARS